MFYFVVRHLRWLARVPGMPHLFDALLLAWTCLWSRSRLAAMEALEAQALHHLPGIRLRVHRFGGISFAQAGRELGHIHGNGLLDARVGRERREALIAAGRVRPHHVLPNSGWVSFQMESVDDVSFALDLLSGWQTVRDPSASLGMTEVEPRLTANRRVGYGSLDFARDDRNYIEKRFALQKCRLRHFLVVIPSEVEGSISYCHLPFGA